MNNFFTKLKLIDTITVELPMNQSDFISTLSSNLDKPQWDFFDIFSRSKNSYKGIVGYEDFEIKRKASFLNAGNISKSKGIVKTSTNGITIDIVVNGVHRIFLVWFILLPLVYIFLIFSFVSEGKADVILVPFILLHAAFMIGIPYYIMRKNVKATKHDLERDLYFMMRNKLRIVG